MAPDLLDSLNSAAFSLADAPVTWAELLGFVTGVATVWLAAQRRMATWPLGIANSAFFGLLFLDSDLYADASLQVVYLVLGAFGWWAWLRLGPDDDGLEVRSAARRTRWLVVVAAVATTAALIPILRAAGDSAPTLDGLTTALSLAAQLLLCLKHTQNWYWWIAADLIYIPLYLSRGLVLTALVYVIFLAICVRALIDWRALERQPALAT